MYHNRIKRESCGHSVFYHISNRVAGGEFLFGEEEKDKLRQLLFEGEQRFGYEVWDYVIMDNHYHALIHVPDMNKMPRDRVVQLWNVRKKLTTFMEPSEESIAAFRVKLHDISCIVSNFQQRFTQWFNKKHGRWGKLFGGRFNGVILDAGATVSRMMGYISMNPVRAGIVDDPAEYFWSGYSERIRNGRLRENELEIINALKWQMGLPRDFTEEDETKVLEKFWRHFRDYLLRHRMKWNDEEIRTLKDLLNRDSQPVELSWPERMCLKTRFTSGGVALGSKEFIRGVLDEFSNILGFRRTRDPVEARGWDSSYSIRQHRKWIG